MMAWRAAISFFYVVVAIVVACYFPLGALEDFAGISVTGVALMVSGILPAMTLLVNTMKGEGRSPRSVRVLYEKLHRTLNNLVHAFIRAYLFIVFVLIAVIWKYVDAPCYIDAPCKDLIHRILIFFAVFLLLVFIHRYKIAFRTFFGVLYLKKDEALHISEKENDKLESQAKEDTRLPSDNYSAKANPLHKVEASD